LKSGETRLRIASPATWRKKAVKGLRRPRSLRPADLAAVSAYDDIAERLPLAFEPLPERGMAAERRQPQHDEAVESQMVD
jgi:hypothetical protein